MPRLWTKRMTPEERELEIAYRRAVLSLPSDTPRQDHPYPEFFTTSTYHLPRSFTTHQDEFLMTSFSDFQRTLKANKIKRWFADFFQLWAGRFPEEPRIARERQKSIIMFYINLLARQWTGDGRPEGKDGRMDVIIYVSRSVMESHWKQRVTSRRKKWRIEGGSKKESPDRDHMDTLTATEVANAQDIPDYIPSYIAAQRRVLDRYYSNHKIEQSQLPRSQLVGCHGVPRLGTAFGAIGVHDGLNLRILATACLLGPEVEACVALSVGACPNSDRATELLAALAFIIE
ncbi:hypothetical protein BDZ89DRAFT_1036142 [Hymenopellis radicata]|nr:hypothetical protein BDZ89DRAFT_1036142 [Hymenopellis radicata]